MKTKYPLLSLMARSRINLCLSTAGCIFATFTGSALAQTSWTGNTNQGWTSATWSNGVPTAGSAITLTPTSSATLSVNTAAVGASLDFSSALGTGLTISNGQSLTITGAIADTGSGNATLSVNNSTVGNAATVLSASSLAATTLNFNGTAGGAQFLTTSFNITLGVQLQIGAVNNDNTFRQTGGIIDISNGDFGLTFNEALSNPTSGTTLYIMDGGSLRAGRIGVASGNGNNTTVARFASTGVFEWNNGTIQNRTSNGTLNIQNGTANSGATANTAQFNTSKPLKIELSQSGSHIFDVEGSGGIINLTGSAELVNKTGEAGTLTKSGLGTLNLTGGGTHAVSTWTGDTTVTAGVLATNYNLIAASTNTTLSDAYSAGSRLVLNGGNFTMTGRGSAGASVSGTVSGNASGGFSVTIPSTTGLVAGQSVSGTNIPAGAYIRRILNGTVIELSHQSTGNVALNGIALTFGAASFTNTQTINDVTLTPAISTVTVNPGTGTSTTLLSFGNVTGTGGLTKAGTGTLRLTGALDYAGATAVSAGTLEFAPSAGSSTLTGNITGTGAILKSGNGTTILATSTSGGSSFSGALRVAGGTLQIGSTTTSNNSDQRLTAVSSVQVDSGATMILKNSSAIPGGTPITLAGTLRTDTTGVSGGGFHNGLGAITFNGGTLTTANGANATSFQTYVLNGNVTVTGSSVANITAGGSAGNGVHLLNNAIGSRTFEVADVTSSAAADLIVLASLLNASNGTQAASLIKTGAGTMLLSGVNTYTGATSVNNGALIVNGSISTSVLTTVASGATISGDGITGALTVLAGGDIKPGNSPGSLDISGNYIQAGTYTAEINGLIAGTGYDQINVTGGVNITGGSLVTMFSGTYALNNMVFILTNDAADAIIGTYNSFAQGAVVANYGGFDWRISYLADSVGSTFTGGNDIALMAIPEPNAAALLGGFGLFALLRRRRN
jgi:autotransporter-associated beta strand protein